MGIDDHIVHHLSVQYRVLFSFYDEELTSTRCFKLQADPAQMLNVPVIPLGAMMNAIHPLASRPPYALAYLGYQVSARQMMEPDLFKKLVCNNFCKCYCFIVPALHFAGQSFPVADPQEQYGSHNFHINFQTAPQKLH